MRCLQAVRAGRGRYRARQDVPPEMFRLRQVQDDLRLRRKGDLHEEPVRVHALHRSGEVTSQIAGQRGARQEGEKNQKREEHQTNQVRITASTG